jgi:F-type H+-transporting ATPase subunit a
MLEHLGEKLIAHVSIGGFSFSFDIVIIITSWIVIALLVIFAVILRRSLRQDVEEKPNRMQALLDILIDFLKGQLASGFASERLAHELFPFVSTVFLYVLLCNWISLIPYLESPTKDLNVTLSMAILVFFMSQIFAVRLKGVRKYLKGFVEPYPFMLPINIMGEVAKPISHAFRLFGNIFGGSILIALVYSFSITRWGVPVLLNAYFDLFAGFVQAFVFAILAVAYINVAVES